MAADMWIHTNVFSQSSVIWKLKMLYVGPIIVFVLFMKEISLSKVFLDLPTIVMNHDWHILFVITVATIFFWRSLLNFFFLNQLIAFTLFVYATFFVSSRHHYSQAWNNFEHRVVVQTCRVCLLRLQEPSSNESNLFLSTRNSWRPYACKNLSEKCSYW